MTPEQPPRVGLGVIKRAAIAAVLIVFATAGAVSATVILEVKQIQREIIGDGEQLVDIPEVTTVDPGRARTIMVLGSDARYRDRRDEPPRSDTILLVRVNPKKDVISVMSIPRDLQVMIPGRGYDKINAAYELGGPRLTVRTVKQLLSTPGEPFNVNNVVIVNFGRLPARRELHRRRLGRRRPALLQRPHRPGRLRRHRPPARLPEALGL